ncbi:MAG: hypothetical protein U1E27_05345 [Kiritimatiellia bacterium]|nr:hypothetical protein [Kiritimatiellia bacterium]
MSLGFIQASGKGAEGLIYLVFGIIWVVIQVMNAAARKKKRQERAGIPARPPVPSRSPDMPERAPFEGSTVSPGKSELEDFLRELAGLPPPPVVPAPLPVPAPARPRVSRRAHSAAAPVPRIRAQAPIGGRAISGEPVQSIEPSLAATRPATGSVLRMANIRFPTMPTLSMRGMNMGGGADVGPDARNAVRARSSRRAMRDALVWKIALDSPRALLSPGGDSLWNPRSG